MPREYDIPTTTATATPTTSTTVVNKPLVNLATLTTDELKTIKTNAANWGMSVEEYLTTRKGIDELGYFGDVPSYDRLTAEEKKSVTNPDGTIDTIAMLTILNKKAREAGVNQFSMFGGGAGGGGRQLPVGGYDAQGNPTPGGQYNAQGQFVGTTATSAGTPEQIAQRKSAYDLLYQEFNQYGLGSLVEPLKGLIMEGVPASEFTIRLRESEPYKKRFAANAQRIAKGLRALSEAEYIQKEDAYQNIMRNYGMPESYYKKGDLGQQAGFEKLIAGDVSSAELEDRLQTAYNRVINAAPEVSQALKSFYPDITNGDILAYALDPDQGLNNIKRKVTAAEIGGAAAMAGLTSGAARAEELARYGVTGEAARQGYQTIADVVPRGSQLSEFYKQSPYTQTTAEQEVFGLTGATEAAKQRKRLTQMEQASFAGSAGVAGGALARERAGSF